MAAGSVLVLLAAPAQYLGRQQDDLLYIIASQSLAHGSYRLFTAVGRPLLLMITPGWPALLLPVSLLCPGRLGAYEALATALQMLVPWAAFAWARRTLEDETALLLALLCAASPLLLSQAGAVMSETAFLLASLALLARADEGGAAAGGWLAAALQLRPAGAALLPAALAPSWRRKRWRKLALAAAIPAAAGGAWCAGCWLLARRGMRAPGTLAYAGRSWAFPLALGGLGKIRFYASSLGGGFLPARWAAAAVALGAALMLSAAWGCARALRRRWDEPTALALAGSAAMYAVWAWNYERYWLTLLPLFWWACARAWGRAAKPLLAALLLLELAFGVRPWLGGTRWRRVELPRSYAWLSSHLSRGQAFASAAYIRDGFYAGRPCAPLPDAPSAARAAAQLRARRIGYALWQRRLDIGVADPDSSALEARLERAGRQLQDGRYFDKVYDDAAEGSAVYRLKDPRDNHVTGSK